MKQYDKCIICGSSSINPHLHGRDPDIDLELCDVCYWQIRAKESFPSTDGFDMKALEWAFKVKERTCKHGQS